MSLYALFVIICLPCFYYWRFPLVANIDWYSFALEFIMALTILACVHFLRLDKKTYTSNQFLYVGFSLLFTALLADTLDEIFLPSALVTILLEKLFQITGFIVVLLGIRLWLINQKQQKKSLVELATTDPLTGCFTRRYFVDKAQALFDSERGFSLLLMDIDHFKKINDNYGHSTGDTALVELTKLIKKHIRKDDLLARWGGEEFFLLLPDTEQPCAFERANKLRKLLEEKVIDYPAGQFQMTMSIGLAEKSPEVADLASLFELADQNLYRAKDRGRNQVVG
ncbi:GGDEF domain-containing protein [Catenovulum sp. SM1970]|uniref:GGDEF domain-containing protein n=1 Tax=Marinifaba aquimaris TaxID=2741323 RepID=UPI001572D808|nr:GGDEF domain-containing protein [Marinifaba aquimaris]NTS76261.1 GGDEF domain-containing protein [Marinifaba aquimaris]